MNQRTPDEAQMGRTLAETAQLNSRERQAGERAREAVSHAAVEDARHAARAARRNARIFVGAGVLILLFLAVAVLLPAG